MKYNVDPWNLSAALLGATGVAMGAFGAHALADLLRDSGHTATWTTATRYHLVHSVALVALVLIRPSRFRRPALLWLTGTLLFSGSLYGLSLGGPGWLGPVTPLGGLLLILGWLALATCHPGPGPRASADAV